MNPTASEKLDAVLATAAAARAAGSEITFDDLGIHRTVYWAYRNTKEAENERLDFDDVVWEKDIPGILESCRRFGIDRFTISSGMSSMAETIWELEQNGAKLVGMTRVNCRFEDWKTGLRQTKPAFEIEVLPA